MINLVCFFKGHDIFLIENFSPDFRKIGCKRCKKIFCMYDGVKSILPWDIDFEEWYREFRSLNLKETEK